MTVLKSTQLLGYGLITAAVMLTAAPDAHAQLLDAHERIILSFNDPVQVPGATLKPGKYEFSLLSSEGSQQVVEISNVESRQPIAILLAVPVVRQATESTSDPLVSMLPAGKGEAPALFRYFSPNSLYGHQLEYPRHQARALVRPNQAIVVSDKGVG